MSTQHFKIFFAAIASFPLLGIASDAACSFSGPSGSAADFLNLDCTCENCAHLECTSSDCSCEDNGDDSEDETIALTVFDPCDCDEEEAVELTLTSPGLRRGFGSNQGHRLLLTCHNHMDFYSAEITFFRFCITQIATLLEDFRFIYSIFLATGNRKTINNKIFIFSCPLKQ